MMTQVCMICHKKNDDSVLRQMQNIALLVNGKKSGNKEDIRKLVDVFSISIHAPHCPYGLHCQALSEMETTARHIAIRIAPELAGYIRDANENELYQLLRLLQGYFPAVYHTVERMWHETHV